MLDWAHGETGRQSSPGCHLVGRAAAVVTLAPWELWLRGWLGITLVAVGLVWSLHVVSFGHVKECALWLGCVGMAVSLAASSPTAWAGFRAWMPAWCGLLVLGSLSMARAQVPWLTVEAVLRSVALLSVASMAYRIGQRDGGRRFVGWTIVVTATAAAGLALGQRVGVLDAMFPVFPHYDQKMYSVFGNSGLLGGYLALGIVLLPGLMGDRRLIGTVRLLAYAAGAVMMLALVLAASRGAQLALLCGWGVYAVVPGHSRRLSLRKGVPAALLLLLVFVMAGAPSLSKWAMAFQADDVGVAVRGWIWRASGLMLQEQLLLGVGLGNYLYGLPPYLGVPGSGVPALTTVYHAHMDILELACEVGVVGILLLSGQLVALRLHSVMAAAGLMTLVVFSCVHPMWSSAPHALCFLLLLGMNLSPPNESFARRVAPRGRALSLGMAGLLVGSALLYGATVVGPSFLLRRAEDQHLAGRRADVAYEMAVSGWGYRGEAWESRGMYLLEQGAYAEAGQCFESARRELNTGRLHLLLGRVAQQLGREAEARACFQQAVVRGVLLEEREEEGVAQ